MRRLSMLAGLLLIAFLAPPAYSTPFDLIYTDQMNVALCSNGCGITLAGSDFALIVNKGTTDITGAQMYGTVLTATSSSPEVGLFPFVNNPGGLDPTPIHPNEAVGSVSSGPPDNTLLLSRVLPGESFRNSSPAQFLAFSVRRTGTNSFTGDVVFDVTTTLGADVATFQMVAHVSLGDFAISFPHVARVSSVPLVTPAQVTSWGRIKTLYR